MADKKFKEEFTHKDEPDDEMKVPTSEIKPILTGKIVADVKGFFTVEYKVAGISYGARIAHAPDTKLGVGDDIQIPT